MTMSTGTTVRAIGGRYIRGRFCTKTMSVPRSPDEKDVISDCGVRKRYASIRVCQYSRLVKS